MSSILFDKLSIFNPDAIDEINFDVGRHFASPMGRVVLPPTQEVKLLHFKNLGGEYLVARTDALRARRTAMDRENGWSDHLERSPEELRRDLEAMFRSSKKVV